MQKTKLFPLKLPQNFHGSTKNFESTTDKYLKRSNLREESDQPSKKVGKWQRKISDGDVLQQRLEYLVHPAKISTDNPDWVKSTYHYYHRSQAKPYHKETRDDRKKFDVFGQKKIDPITNRKSQSTPFIRKQLISKQVASKIGVDYQHPLGMRKSKLSQQLANKIGFVQMRTNLIKRPQLKVGSLHQNNYIDTYTVN